MSPQSNTYSRSVFGGGGAADASRLRAPPRPTHRAAAESAASDCLRKPSISIPLRLAAPLARFQHAGVATSTALALRPKPLGPCALHGGDRWHRDDCGF